MISSHLSHNPTRLLWLAMGVSLLILVAVLAYRLAPVLPGPGEREHEIRPIGHLQAPASAQATLAIVERNPFDPSGAHWSQTGKGAEAAVTGPIKGVVLVPGMNVVLTEGRPVRIGDMLEGGKLLGVEGERLIIETSEGLKRVDLPGSRRPHLKDLNQR